MQANNLLYPWTRTLSNNIYRKVYPRGENSYGIDGGKRRRYWVKQTMQVKVLRPVVEWPVTEAGGGLF